MVTRFVSMKNADTVTLMGLASVMSLSPLELPIVNAPAGMSAMPAGMITLLVLNNRKNLARDVLVTVTVKLLLTVTGMILLIVTQLGAARLVVFRSEEHTSELQSLRHLVCR